MIEYGWLSPDGVFYQCLYGKHIALVESLGFESETVLDDEGWWKLAGSIDSNHSYWSGLKPATPSQRQAIVRICQESMYAQKPSFFDFQGLEEIRKDTDKYNEFLAERDPVFAETLEESKQEDVRKEDTSEFTNPKGQKIRITDYPSVEMTVPLRVDQLQGKFTHDPHIAWSETFYLTCVDVSDDNDELIGCIRAGIDGRISIHRGNTRVVIEVEDLWNAVCQVMDRLEDRSEKLDVELFD